MKDYYKLKYLVTETFYEDILKENYTIGQTASRCFVEFYEELSKNNIESIILISTILLRIAVHKVEQLENFIEKYDKMLEILNKIDLDDYLDVEEKEELLYDIACIETCIEKYVEKD